MRRKKSIERCTHKGEREKAKIRYKDQVAALFSLRNRCGTQRAYLCPRCGGWHTTSIL